MRHHLIVTTLILVASVFPLAAQGPDANDSQQILSLIKEVQAQQAQIADNQTKIQEKLSAIGEDLRIARDFTKRGL